ncbi:hypothetical protein IQ07DRAFT_413446 [Pyrenochaeta sp. DS3sAY3a]|nr:hypothetical protein IQ07DRAFT_413446 [Pyrenochaeta sp. DS3sAY3a]
MPSSKGKPTDPKLREKVKEDVKNETNKDGGGKGQWSAWKAAKLSKEYEKKGGGYENEAGSKNEPKKGTPEKKPAAKKKAEEKAEEKSDSSSQHDEERDEEKKEDDAPKTEQKPKANTGAKKSSAKNGTKTEQTKKQSTTKVKGKEQVEATRKSSRIADNKKRTTGDSDEEGSARAKKSKS